MTQSSEQHRPPPGRHSGTLAPFGTVPRCRTAAAGRTGTRGTTAAKVACLLLLLGSVLHRSLHADDLDVGDVQRLSGGAGSAYYVSSTGRDSNNGLAVDRAFRTIQKAVDLVNPGDSVIVLPGVYTASSPGVDVVTFTRSGTPEHWITLRNFPGARPVIFNEASWQGVNVLGASYIVIEGLEVRGSHSLISEVASGTGDHLNPATNGNCIMAHKDGARNPHHLMIRNNVVRNCPGGGIGTNYADYVTISGNIVYNTSWGSKWGTSGISIYESRDFDDGAGYRNFVVNNLVYGNEQRLATHDRGKITDGNGIIIDDLNNSQTTSVPYGGRTLVQNNVSYQNGGRGIHVYQSDRVDVINNTTFWNSERIRGDGEISVVYSRDVRVINNIAHARPGRHASYQYESDVAYANNIFYNGPVEGEDAHHIAQSPQFVDASAGNFRVRSGSPAIDAADASFAPPTDIRGVVRPQGAGPDLGAYEALQ